MNSVPNPNGKYDNINFYWQVDYLKFHCFTCNLKCKIVVSGIGCRCATGWRVIQDVGYYRRSSGNNHGDTLGRNGDNGLKCEVD